MIHLAVDVQRDRRLHRPTPDLYAQVAEVESLAELLPVHDCRHVHDDRWRWEFGTYGALGFHVAPAFDVEVTRREPWSVHFVTVGEVTEGAAGHGQVLLSERGPAATHVEARVVVEVDLSVPRMLARPLRGVLVHELRVVLDGLLDGLATTGGHSGRG